MDELSSKELDDSIFGTDSHLDWAEEANSLEVLNDRRFDKKPAAAKSKATEEPSNRQRRASPPRSTQDSRRRGSRGDSGKDIPSRTAAAGGGRRQQNDRPLPPPPQTRTDLPRPARHSGDSSNYSRSASRGEYSTNRSSRARGGGRSVSRVGGPPPPPPAQQQSHGINIRGARTTMRDRSLSMERRPSSLDHGRGWRDLPPPAGRARADQADRWEHDKFDGTSSAPTARGGHDRSRSSATSAIQNTGPLPADLEFIGKEGVSHVTIKRRDSNASSSRAYPSSSYEPPRRQFIDTSAPPMPTTSIESSVRKPSISKAPVPAAAPAAVRPISPRSPTTTEPYRAPHRRQSSADTTTPLLPLSAATIATPLLTPQASVPERNSLHPDEPVIGKAEEEQEVANESSSSAEMEWENFVANGGLDMPIDRITDDLLKHPRSRSQSVFSPAAEPPRSVPEQQRRDPPHVFTDGSSGLDRAHD
ncbi:hypothetical protein GGI21_004659, partial [Coemansia aciculifera]